MQHTDKAIAEFEAWWLKQIWHECFEDVKDQMRNVWLASREEFVIELPAKQRPAVDDDEAWHRTRNSTIDACRRYIEAAGVTVRG
ncbi:MAG: hypothetical protein ACLGIW_06695 [Gammaproteobacteria bacterium]